MSQIKNTKTETLVVAVTMAIALLAPAAWMWSGWYVDAAAPTLTDMLFKFGLFVLLTGLIEVITMPLTLPFWYLLTGVVATVIHSIRFAYTRLLSVGQPRY